MKKLAFTCFIFIVFILHPYIVKAIYNPLSVPNNKFGIHILFPSEITQAASLVNSQHGDWGYITIPIQANDRDLDKWWHFMRQTNQLHLIPILRITTLPNGGTWDQATPTDLVDFANFLDQLPWPTQNRYIIIFNEVNRAQEWGGQVNPQKYAQILKNAYLIFKQKSPDFFILPSALDTAVPTSSTSLSAPQFLTQMQTSIPNIWDYIDGWNSHAYPNPNFAASPFKRGWQSITSYKNELRFIHKELPVFITETGWDLTKISNPYRYYQLAWQTWLSDKQVVAVTPFLLHAEGQFAAFSFLKNNQPTSAWQATFDFPKQAGQPLLAVLPQSSPPPSSSPSSLPNTSPPFYNFSHILDNISHFFNQLFNLFTKFNDK